MYVPCRWLSEYVDLGLAERSPVEIADELAERLTLAGLEVEGSVRVAPVTGLVVGRVESAEPHPNADQLSVCEVDVGSETLEIVCGAPNVAAGQIVPVVLPDGTLPSGLRITVRPLRGVASHGMICSRAELGLEESSAGIWALDPSWGLEPGEDFATKLEFDDVVLDISITSNRPDLLGIYGIAREIAAIRRVPLAELDLTLDESDPPAEELVSVSLESPEDAPRYSARLLSDLTIADSPPWLQHRLTKAGMRPLSNVVDATNYVMLELGHPLHPFDADGISDRILVRRAKAGERFRTLDRAERTLTEQTLLITDELETLAIAGIMGGERSEIREETTRVLLEAATFNDALIRHASRDLGLRTEASQRFGRGVDAAGVETASIRAAHWMQRLSGCRVHRGCADAYPHPKSGRTVTLREGQVRRLLGVDVPAQEIVDILTRLGLECSTSDGVVEAAVPTRRADLEREADLVEEVGRIFGYDRVPSTAPHAALRMGRKDRHERFKDRVREVLVGLGMDEAVHDGFEATAWSDVMGWEDDDRTAVRNPMHDGQAWLRVALLPGLLAAAGRNLNQGVDGGMLFEIGRVFPKAAGEHDAVAGVLFGRSGLPLSGKAPTELGHAKGLLFAMLSALRIEDPHLDPEGIPPYIERGRGGVLVGGGEPLGSFGVLGAAVRELLATTSDVIVFECDLRSLETASAGQESFVPPSRYPASKRDLSLLAPEGISERVIRAEIASEPEIERLLLYDTYHGEQVEEGRKSLTYELVLRAADRTLTDDEVAAVIERIETRLGALGITLRR
ncbi:MAG: phenylalanine--tRNA ligase subunit beta [Candidatus Bipolaricaulota bacterium]|nr:MAG: phenylalanine--tRNA ligase subunit beta [Candidatus Bipolaricaulota bacterium]